MAALSRLDLGPNLRTWLGPGVFRTLSTRRRSIGLPTVVWPLMLPGVFNRLLLPALLIAGLLACNQPAADGSAAPAEPDGSAAVADAPAKAEDVAAGDAKHEKHDERPLPAFSGRTLAGDQLAVSSLIGKRLLIFFFNPEVKGSTVVAEAVTQVAEFRGSHNYNVLGIATGSDFKTAQEFVTARGIDFPVIDDSTARIAQRLGLRAPIAILGITAEGYVEFGMGQFPTEEPDGARAVEATLRASLRLPALSNDSQPELGTRPQAPTFAAKDFDSGESFDLGAQRGKPVVLVFFLHTCPHCHDALKSMKKAFAEMPADKRPVLVGIEVTGHTAAVRSTLADQELDFFPVLFDDDGSIRSDYGVFGSVPDIFVIDAEGRIASRTQGWREDVDSPLLRMRVAQLAGAPVPMLLRSKGYSGNENCSVCHENQHATWMIDKHSRAFDSLVKHGEAANPECVGCHVVGYGEAGGFVDSQETPHLENVGCESCHGRGGPHLSPQPVRVTNYASICVTCHNPTHSLGFEYATFLPKISHAANAHILTLPLAERRKLLEERGVRRANLLPTGARLVGSDACQSCHQAEFETWIKSEHAHAGSRLLAAPDGFDTACVKCHSTGYGQTGGFPEGGALAEHSDLGRVGCESCHGPGGDHVGEKAPKFGNIVSLGDKCDSCVILQICGSCHDEANDPGFEFAVEAKVEKQRHGTTEPGTGKPLNASAASGG
jgi:peroxiredoxin